MKSLILSDGRKSAVRLFCSMVCFVPSVLMAHPGHYHPDETDEFDFLRATFFHTHGALEFALAALVIASISVGCLNHKPAIRYSALAMALGSLWMLPIL